MFFSIFKFKFKIKKQKLLTEKETTKEKEEQKVTVLPIYTETILYRVFEHCTEKKWIVLKAFTEKVKKPMFFYIVKNETIKKEVGTGTETTKIVVAPERIQRLEEAIEEELLKTEYGEYILYEYKEDIKIAFIYLAIGTTVRYPPIYLSGATVTQLTQKAPKIEPEGEIRIKFKNDRVIWEYEIFSEIMKSESIKKEIEKIINWFILDFLLNHPKD